MEPRSEILEQYQRECSPEEYQEIRQLYKDHSIAEEQRNILGLLSTLTEDCIYTLPQAGHSWKGQEGAAQFYNELLTAFPDIDFQLENIVIGPQGVCELARVTGTHRESWLGRKADGQTVDFKVVIFFPWDPEHKLFKGEIMYIDHFHELMGRTE